jgi:hypothetical protein
VTRPSTGTYCLTAAAGIDPRAVATVAAEEFELSGIDGFVGIVGSGSACLAGQFEVDTENSAGSATNSISFHLIVP